MKYPWSDVTGFPELDFGYLKFKLYWPPHLKMEPKNTRFISTLPQQDGRQPVS